jgi:hypothetical protein
MKEIYWQVQDIFYIFIASNMVGKEERKGKGFKSSHSGKEGEEQYAGPGEG